MRRVGRRRRFFGVVAAPLDAAALVVEMGTSSPGEIAFLAELARPDVRLILNVGPAHLEELGGLDGVALEKGALVTTGSAGDVAVLNLDDPRVAKLELPAGMRRIGWGREVGDIRLESATLDPISLTTHAVWKTPEGEVSARLPVPGAHIAHNAAAALGVAWALGVPLAAAAAALEGYTPVGMRLRTVDLPSGAIALNDAYNANPSSMAASLRLLAELPGRRVAVMGDMLELGADEAQWHREVAVLADGLGLDLVVLVGPRMTATANVFDTTEVWAHADTVGAIDPLYEWLQSGDCVLLKGSRGAQVERILQGLVVRHDQTSASGGN